MPLAFVAPRLADSGVLSSRMRNTCPEPGAEVAHCFCQAYHGEDHVKLVGIKIGQAKVLDSNVMPGTEDCEYKKKISEKKEGRNANTHFTSSGHPKKLS